MLCFIRHVYGVVVLRCELPPRVAVLAQSSTCVSLETQFQSMLPRRRAVFASDLAAASAFAFVSAFY